MKLSKHLRNKILINIVKAVFKDKLDKLTAQYSTLTEQVHSYVLDSDGVTVLQLFEIPAEYLRTDDDTYVNVNGERHRFSFGGCIFSISEDGLFYSSVSYEYRPARATNSNTPVLAKTNKLGKVVLSHAKSVVKLEKEVGDYSNQVAALLESVNTIEKLLKVAPELKNYIPEASTPVNLPVVNYSAVTTPLKKLEQV